MKLEEGKFYFEHGVPGYDSDLIYIYKIITSLDNEKYAIIYGANHTFGGEISLDIFNLSSGYTFVEMKSLEDVINLVKNNVLNPYEGETFIDFYKIINKYKKTNDFKARLGSL